MIQAYVLVQAMPGQPGQVAGAIGAVQGVVSTDVVGGPFDVIVRVEAPDMDELGRLLIARIQTVPGVVRTLTCPVVRL